MIKVFYNNTAYEIEKEMPVAYFLKEIAKIDITGILACKVFNEAKNLNLNTTKAEKKLNWKNIFSTKFALNQTVLWYKNFKLLDFFRGSILW